MTTEHTPLPWKCDRQRGNADLWGITHQLEGFSSTEVDIAVDLRKANAEYIVRACNAYPELVAALEDMQAWKGEVLRLSRSLPDRGDAMSESFRRIDAALARARAEAS